MDSWFFEEVISHQKDKDQLYKTMGDTGAEAPPAWELYKENAQPLKRGRDSKKLGLSLSTRATGGADPNLEKIAEFEGMVTKEEIETSDDPLAIWIRYINFVRDEYPGSSKCVPIMERCTRQLCHDPRYQNDDRFIKVNSCCYRCYRFFVFYKSCSSSPFPLSFCV